MCFYPDYDWTASVVETTPGTVDKPTRCDECGKEIQAGEWRLHIAMQEHEECQTCDEFGDSYNEDDPQDPATCEHDFGESFDYDRCEACDQILKAIRAVEQKEGCPSYAQQPALCELREVFSEHSGAPVYAAHAIEMFPELGSVPWLVNALVSDSDY